MTPSDRIHRNARMILEAADSFDCHWYGVRCWDRLMLHSKHGWTVEEDTLRIDIHRTTARTILRGILAPRIWAKLRREVSVLQRIEHDAVPDEMIGDGSVETLQVVLAIMDDMESGE